MYGLEKNECYVGQRVYWVMWRELNVPADYTAYHGYRDGCVPEIWSDVVERIGRQRDSIILERYGSLRIPVYSCPQDAITGTYEIYCHLYLGGGYARTKPLWSLGKTSVILRHLAELEFNLHNAAAKTE
jgi:hypothetical protein